MQLLHWIIFIKVVLFSFIFTDKRRNQNTALSVTATIKTGRAKFVVKWHWNYKLAGFSSTNNSYIIEKTYMLFFGHSSSLIKWLVKKEFEKCYEQSSRGKLMKLLCKGKILCSRNECVNHHHLINMTNHPNMTIRSNCVLCR